MTAKHKIRNHSISFVRYIDTQYSKNVKIIRTDSGYEFYMITFLMKNVLFIILFVLQQNEMVGRKH